MTIKQFERVNVAQLTQYIIRNKSTREIVECFIVDYLAEIEKFIEQTDIRDKYNGAKIIAVDFISIGSKSGLFVEAEI